MRLYHVGGHKYPLSGLVEFDIANPPALCAVHGRRQRLDEHAIDEDRDRRPALTPAMIRIILGPQVILDGTRVHDVDVLWAVTTGVVQGVDRCAPGG